MAQPTNHAAPIDLQAWEAHFRKDHQFQTRMDLARKIGGYGMTGLGAVGIIVPFATSFFFNVPVEGLALVGLWMAGSGVILKTTARHRPDITQPEEARKMLQEMSQVNLDSFVPIQYQIHTHPFKVYELEQIRLIDHKTAHALTAIVNEVAVVFFKTLSDTTRSIDEEYAQSKNRFNEIWGRVIATSPLQQIAQQGSSLNV